MYKKGIILLYPKKDNEKVLLVDQKGQPILVETHRPIGFKMEQTNPR